MLIDFRKLFPKYNLKFSGVLHVGANRGEEAPVYDELGIKRQIWVEANPDMISALEQATVHNPFATVLPWAAGDEEKKVVFHVSNNQSQSSSVLDLGLHKEEHPDVHYVKDIEVQMYRLDKVFDEVAIKGWLLNLDVQGFELNVLKGLGDAINGIEAVYTEVNKAELYVGCALIEDLDYYLGAYGFERVETQFARNKSWGDALYIKTQLKN